MKFRCLKCGFEFEKESAFWNEEIVDFEVDCPKCGFPAEWILNIEEAKEMFGKEE